MRRREYIAALGLLPFLPDGCQRRRRPALALATADTESHVAVLDAATGRVRTRVATLEGPRSIEAAGGSRAVVAHTDKITDLAQFVAALSPLQPRLY